jgi:hypothetical protein
MLLGFVVVVIVLPIAFLLLLGMLQNRRVGQRNQQVDGLLEAASSERRDDLAQAVASGVPIDVRDDEGNSALHRAHYEHQAVAVALLKEFGADENLRNKLGLTPGDMGKLAHAEAAIRRGARLLNERGTWIDPEAGRSIYDELGRVQVHVYKPAIVRVVLAATGIRRRVLFLAIKLGRPGSEEQLCRVLDGFGSKELAEDFLNCGSTTLADAAELWAKRHRYVVHRSGGAHRVSWATF